jgi:hypothetical protein
VEKKSISVLKISVKNQPMALDSASAPFSFIYVYFINLFENAQAKIQEILQIMTFYRRLNNSRQDILKLYLNQASGVI